MSREAFNISSVNPNDQIGGGGCACSNGKVEDCHGPFAVFYATETDNNLSPHVVVGAQCLRQAVKRIDSGELLAAGEDDGDDNVPGAEEVASTWEETPIHPVSHEVAAVAAIEDDGIPTV